MLNCWPACRRQDAASSVAEDEGVEEPANSHTGTHHGTRYEASEARYYLDAFRTRSPAKFGDVNGLLEFFFLATTPGD